MRTGKKIEKQLVFNLFSKVTCILQISNCISFQIITLFYHFLTTMDNDDVCILNKFSLVLCFVHTHLFENSKITRQIFFNNISKWLWDDSTFFLSLYSGLDELIFKYSFLKHIIVHCTWVVKLKMYLIKVTTSGANHFR